MEEGTSSKINLGILESRMSTKSSLISLYSRLSEPAITRTLLSARRQNHNDNVYNNSVFKALRKKHDLAT